MASLMDDSNPVEANYHEGIDQGMPISMDTSSLDNQSLHELLSTMSTDALPSSTLTSSPDAPPPPPPIGLPTSDPNMTVTSSSSSPILRPQTIEDLLQWAQERGYSGKPG
ncbi:hypothetical protein BDZ89DRAFT_1147535 [Hymenopellis radicata]|nr:hypothetical protein BDZ89DRAFT_1147535 [Hymenopellis radicata]